MPKIDWLPLLTFLLITTLSPGPNNLSCASMGVQHGFKKSRAYIMGITIGLVFLMLLIGFISTALLTYFPKFEPVLRYIGAAYILWLAYTSLNATYANGESDCAPLGFKDGFLLQYLNPKAMLFGMTVYTTYLVPIIGQPFWIILAALLLGARGFFINSSWVLFGAAVKTWLAKPAFGRAFNLCLALLLVYNAADLIHLPDLLANWFA